MKDKEASPENHSKTQTKKSFRFKEAGKYRKSHTWARNDTAPATNATTPATNATITTDAGQGPEKNLHLPRDPTEDPFKLYNKYKIHEKSDDPNPHPVLEAFYMIQSNSFNDINRYPPVAIDRWGTKNMKIETDMSNYRINDAWEKLKKQHKLNKKLQPTDKFFFFRLSGLNIYYTNTNTDINILGAISIKSIDRIELPKMDATTEYITTCFNVRDLEHQTYKLCGLQEEEVKHWYCQIKVFLGEVDIDLCNNMGDENTKIITKTVEITQPIVIVPTASPHCNQKWNYQNSGLDWECECSEGKEQSPVDLPDKSKVIETAVTPLFRYAKIKAHDVEQTLDGN